MMTDSSGHGTMIGIGVGVAAAAVVGYCIYFDHKRRAAPDFKQKLRAKRRAAREAAERQRSSRTFSMPQVSDPAQLQQFFLQEVQLGEELLSEGDFEGAVDHLTRAVLLCQQPRQLLQILQQTLPPNVFNMLMQRVTEARMNTTSGAGDSSSTRNAGVAGVSMTEQDLE